MTTSDRLVGFSRRALGETEAPGLRLVAGLLFLLYLGLTLTPWTPYPIRYDSLDGAYRAVLNSVALSDQQFGRDIVTTTGPLGFLRNIDHYPGTDKFRILWSVLLAGALALGFSKLFIDRSLPWLGLDLLTVLALLLLVRHQGWRLLPLLGFLFLFAKAATPEPRTALWEIYFAFVLAVSSWILFSELLGNVVAVSGVALIHFAKYRRISPTPAFFVAFLLLLWLLTGQEPRSLWPYLVTSLEVAGGYGEVMARYRSLWEPSLVLLAFSLVVASTLWYGRSRRHLAASLALSAPLAASFFLVFKSSFTRSHPIRSVVIAVLLGFIALANLSLARRLLAEGKRPRLALLALAACLGVNAGFLFLGREPAQVLPYLQTVSRIPLGQVRGFGARLRQSDLFARSQERALGDVRARFPIPPLDGTVDWFGDRQGILLAHAQQYRPRPVFQRFVAFTPRLAKLNGEFYAGSSAPEYVVFDFGSFANYPLPLLDSHAYREILSSYDVAAYAGEFLILQRVDRNPFTPTLVLDTTVGLGDPITVADHGAEAPLWIEIDVGDTLLGKLTRTFYKLPSLSMHVVDTTGKRRNFRFASTPARAGFWLSPLLLTPEDMASFLAGGLAAVPPETGVASLRVLPPSRYRGEVRVKVFTLARASSLR